MYDDLLAALARFALAFGDSHLACDAGPSLTCTEVEAVAGLFEAVNLPAAALAWRVGHAQGDDDGDLHNEDGSIRETAVPAQDGWEKHPCVKQGCTNTVPFDDEPYCFEHSPDSGSTVPAFSDRASRR